MRTGKSLCLAAAAAMASMAAPAMPIFAAEETVISAFSAWRGEGQLVQTSANEAMFVGSLDGTVYVNTPLMMASSAVRCPGSSGKAPNSAAVCRNSVRLAS